jgi:membrane-bound ClpP family serine protease
MPVTLRCAAVVVVALSAGAAAAQQAGDGLYVTVANPLTSGEIARVQKRVDDALKKPDRRPRVVVFDFNPDGKDAATDSATCYDLAEYIGRLHDVTTVGYVHARVTGHTVLPVLACKDIVAGPQARLGQVVAPGEPALTESRKNWYRELVGSRRPAHWAVVQKMFDPDVRLRKGRKGDVDWYVDARTTPKDVTVTDNRPLSAAPDGQTVLLPAPQLEATGLAVRAFPDRQALLDGYGLTAAALRDDPLAGKAPQAYRYVLRGAIETGTKEAVVRVVEDVIRKGGNILFLQLECTGGDLQAARDLAGKLTEYQSGENPILIVAFVPDRAPDTAAVVALGCSEIVLSKRKDAATAGGEPAPEAEFGDFEAALGKGGQNPDFWAASLKELAEKQGYPPLLVEGMLRKDLEIFRGHKKENRSVQRLMTADDVQRDKDRGEWTVVAQVKPKGQLLKLSATQAEEHGLARYAVDNRDPAEVYTKYGVDGGKVREATPAWLDRFADFLKQPVVTVLLVVIGFTGLILELKVPGTTVPGIVAALCFILVFWAHTQFSGQVAVLAGLLFLLGLVLILLEIFVLPGFGVTGVTGILLILGALGLVTFGGGDKLPETASEWGQFGGKMAQYLVGMIVAVALALVIARYLPNIPYANRLMLVPPTEEPGAEAEPVLPGAAEAAGLLGAVGTSVTVLRPAGSVRFGDRYVDVVTDGGYVPAGARVQVIEVEGTRIVVKEVG